MEVLPEEAGESPHERGEDEAEEDFPESEGVEEENERRTDCDTRGETIHVVEKVEGVRHAEDPEEADRGVQGGNAGELDLDSCAHGENGRGALTEELESERELLPEDVIEKSHEEDDEGSCEKTEKLRYDPVGFGERVRDFGHEGAHLGDRGERRREQNSQEHRRREREKERNPAEPRNRVPMLLPPARMVEAAPSQAEMLDWIKEQAGSGEGHGQHESVERCPCHFSRPPRRFEGKLQRPEGAHPLSEPPGLRCSDNSPQSALHKALPLLAPRWIAKVRARCGIEER